MLRSGRQFAARLLIGMGLFSLLVAAAFLVRQRNYKRMLAYSSVEHIGIICLGLGFGGYWGDFRRAFPCGQSCAVEIAALHPFR